MFYRIWKLSPSFYYDESSALSSSVPPLLSVLLFPSPVFGWQLLGDVVRQSWVSVRQHWSHCSRCVCVWVPTRLHVLGPVWVQTCWLCSVCLCVWVNRDRQADFLSAAIDELRWAWFPRKSRVRTTNKANYYKSLTLESMRLMSTHLSLLNPCLWLEYHSKFIEWLIDQLFHS